MKLEIDIDNLNSGQINQLIDIIESQNEEIFKDSQVELVNLELSCEILNSKKIKKVKSKKVEQVNKEGEINI
jgi:hypothetical protein